MSVTNLHEISDTEMKAPPEILEQVIDYSTGWKVGRNQGKVRIGGQLYNRNAPGHLVDRQREDWLAGYSAGLSARNQYHRQIAPVSVTYTLDGKEITERTCGTTSRIMNRMAAKGCKMRCISRGAVASIAAASDAHHKTDHEGIRQYPSSNRKPDR